MSATTKRRGRPPGSRDKKPRKRRGRPFFHPKKKKLLNPVVGHFLRFAVEDLNDKVELLEREHQKCVIGLERQLKNTKSMLEDSRKRRDHYKVQAAKLRRVLQDRDKDIVQLNAQLGRRMFRGFKL